MQWEKQGKTLHKTFAFSNYMDGVAFVDKVAMLAEKMNHHPDMLLGYCDAKHFCMMMRGVEKQNAITSTSVMLGALKENAMLRGEFFSLLRSGR